MLSKALSFVAGFLNKKIQMMFDLTDHVVVGSLINPDGTVTENISNKIVMSLINLEHETTINNGMNYVEGTGNKFGKTSPPVYLNMYVMVSANYDSGNYDEALKMLSSVIGIFQANTFFTRQDHPDMSAPLDNLSFELYNIPLKDLSHIWGGIGAKYVPSVVYKVRMIMIAENQIQNEVHGVTGTGKSVNKK